MLLKLVTPPIFAIPLWAPKTFCAKTQQESYEGEPIEYRKLTELVGEIIADFLLTKATVLFDSYYLCPTVTRACEAKNYHYVGVAKKNRNFFPDGRDRDKQKLATYGKNLLNRLGRTTACRGKKYRLAERVGRLSKLGRVKLVFSRRASERSRIAMATNATRWDALRVLNHYLGAAAQGAQAEPKKTRPLDLPSVPQLQNVLRSKLWDDNINSTEQGSRNRRLGGKLKQLILLDT